MADTKYQDQTYKIKVISQKIMTEMMMMMWLSIPSTRFNRAQKTR